MAYGFQALNTNNVVQIDETYRNLMRVASGTWTGGSSAWQTFTFTTQTICPPLVFIRTTSDSTYVGKLWINDGSFTVMTNGNFDWVAFGLTSPTMVSPSNYGMQVFNTAGAVVYDSRYEVPRIQTTISINQVWPDSWNGGGSGAHPSYPYTATFTGWGARPWMCLNSLHFFEDENGYMTAFASKGTNQIEIRMGIMLNQVNWYWPENEVAYSQPLGQIRMPLLKRT